jgi:hypothetical protein
MAKFLGKKNLFSMFSRPTFDNTQGELDDDMHETLYLDRKPDRIPKRKCHIMNEIVKNNENLNSSIYKVYIFPIF